MLTSFGSDCLPCLPPRRDPRFDHPLQRLGKVLQFWLAQWRHPRYRFAGAIHILIFLGFLILITKAGRLLALGISDQFAGPAFGGIAGRVYGLVAAYASTVVFLCVTIAAIRRLVFKPIRYQEPPGHGKGRAADAIFLLALIGVLMAADALFEATGTTIGEAPPASLSWVFQSALVAAPSQFVYNLRLGTYLLHELTFFFLLCYRPFGIQFHVETSLFSIYFAKLDRGTAEAGAMGCPGRATGQPCHPSASRSSKTSPGSTYWTSTPAPIAAGAPTSARRMRSGGRSRPRLLHDQSARLRFRHYPVLGRANDGHAAGRRTLLRGRDLVVHHLRRLRGGMPAARRIYRQDCRFAPRPGRRRQGAAIAAQAAEGAREPRQSVRQRWRRSGPTGRQARSVRVLNGAQHADTLYFVDSITSYDDRIQSIGRATARILGRARRELRHPRRRRSATAATMSGASARRCCSWRLRDHNTEAIRASGVRRIVTADPHAYNALKHDYRDVPPVEHISQVIARAVRSGQHPLEPAGARRRLHLPRSLLPGPAQRHLRGSARRARCDSRPAAGGDEALPRPLVLLRRRRPGAVLRSQRRAADGRAAGPDGGGSRAPA